MSLWPVDQIIPDLLQALRCNSQVILTAPPGAGKTTRIPLVMLRALEEPGKGGKILLLEPRRLAARNAAQFMARQIGETVGQRVGYRTRLETRVSPATRIEVVTEGILTRMIQNDPTLDGIDALIFDEFHERHLHSDLGLALALEAQEALRNDLRILIMSATLDVAGLTRLLPAAPVVASSGQSFPVEIHYARHTPVKPDMPMLAALVREALGKTSGDVLVFLPGVGEIRRLKALLEPLPGCQIVPLYGDLPQAEQERVFTPLADGQRKIVLATAIAESSLTFDGVRVVVDAGWMRVPSFDPRSGMTRLETLRISKASATQRAGRAGRQAEGWCYRAWTEPAQSRLSEYTPPEIQQADLLPLALELVLWGSADPFELRWIDPPSRAHLAYAYDVLHQLGALDDRQRITAQGREMAGLGAHPRLAHLLLCARAGGVEALGAVLAVLLGERDVVDPRIETRGVDLTDRVHWLCGLDTLPGTDGRTRERLQQLVRRWSPGKLELSPDATQWVGRLVARAFPDRIARCRSAGSGRYVMRNGRGAILPEGDALTGSPWLAVATLDGDAREARIFLAAPLTQEVIETDFADQITCEQRVEWDDVQGSVLVAEQRRLGALVLREVTLAGDALVQAQGQIATALLTGVRRRGLGVLPWTPEAQKLRQRVQFLRALTGGEALWPDWSDAALLATLEDWLAGWLNGMSRLTHLQRLDMAQVLNSLLSYEAQTRLREWAPETYRVPSGSQVRIDYSAPECPVLAVKLQELFGLTQTPCIAAGQVPLLLHLLSPARRPVQITRDLAGFWAGSYAEVKKELKGRYPKHPWPDNPLTAAPTRWTKPR